MKRAYVLIDGSTVVGVDVLDQTKGEAHHYPTKREFWESEFGQEDIETIEIDIHDETSEAAVEYEQALKEVDWVTDDED